MAQPVPLVLGVSVLHRALLESGKVQAGGCSGERALAQTPWELCSCKGSTHSDAGKVARDHTEVGLSFKFRSPNPAVTALQWQRLRKRPFLGRSQCKATGTW